MAEWQDFNQVFPSAQRANSSTDYLNSRKMTEWNITNILNSITDTKSFVITKKLPGSDDDLVEFVIGGYYFSLIKEQLTDIDEDNVYVEISLTNPTDTTDHYSELFSVTLTKGTHQNDKTHLQIIKDGVIAPDSLLKFTTVSIDYSGITEIDGNYLPSPPSVQ